jgi:hypothetical protein
VTPHAATATTLPATLAATPAHPGHSATVWLVLLGIGWLTGYALACWLWPFKSCRACDGTGRRRSPSGRAYARCRRCQRTGDRLRAGRWLWNYLHHARSKANR